MAITFYSTREPTSGQAAKMATRLGAGYGWHNVREFGGW